MFLQTKDMFILYFFYIKFNVLLLWDGWVGLSKTSPQETGYCKVSTLICFKLHKVSYISAVIWMLFKKKQQHIFINGTN